MNEEIMALRGWVQNALKDAVDARNQKRRVSKYDSGRISGNISAYQHVLVETSLSNARKNLIEEGLSCIRILEHDNKALEKRLEECKALWRIRT